MNIIKKACLFAAGSLLALTAFGQKNFTIAEATNGMSTTLAVQGIKQGSWQPGSNTFYHVAKKAGAEIWTSIDIPSGTTHEILTVSKLNEGTGSKMKNMPVLNWLDHDHIYVADGQKLELGTVGGGGVSWKHLFTLPEKAANTVIDKHRNIAYTIDNNLHLLTGGGKQVKITADANKNIINGQAVHRNEFGIDGGIFFSPKGNYLAYYKMDQTMVKDYPVANWASDPAVADMIKYPMAGGTSHQVSLCVYNIASGRTVTMNTGTGLDHYLTAVTWSPDEQNIYIAILNREQNHLRLNKYDAHTGNKLSTLFEETDSKYVEPQHPLYFLPNSNDKFLWWSQRDGYMHLYLYNTNGEMIRQVTKGKWVVNEIAGFNERAQEVIYTSSQESPMEKHAYAANWNTGEMRRIDKGEGMHNVWLSGNGEYIYDAYSSDIVPKVGVIRATGSDYENTLLVSADPLAGYRRAKIKSVEMKADDGSPLYGKMILPPDFNPAKKYPVIVYLYNGPHVQLIHNSFPASGNLWYEYMAQKGYIVFTMDGRGSGNRGLKFEQAIFRNVGTNEMNDQLKGVAYLKSLPYVDAGRLGVHGWSYGGFMTTSLMLRHPGIFKVAVAGGPVIDWKMYEIMYTERYMDSPQENPDGYAKANLLTKVKNLQGKLLMIHGTNDDVVVWQHSVKFLKACVDEGVQLDYFVYPGHPHNVRGKDRVHLMQKITDYFDTYLK